MWLSWQSKTKLSRNSFSFFLLLYYLMTVGWACPNLQETLSSRNNKWILFETSCRKIIYIYIYIYIYISQVNITGQFLKYFKKIRCTLGQQLFVHFGTKLSDAKCFRNPCVKIIFALLQNLKIVNVQFFVKTDWAIFNMSLFQIWSWRVQHAHEPLSSNVSWFVLYRNDLHHADKRICRRH